MKKALFLDRDGVVNEAVVHGVYVTSWSQFKLTKGIDALMRAAREKGYEVIIVTNQSQIAKGMITKEGVEEIHNRMSDLLPGLINRICYCPHRNEDGCVCRKPKPGMILASAQELDIDLSQSIMVGDTDKDIEAGQAAGCKTVFLKNEHHAHDLAKCKPDHVVAGPEEVIAFL